MSEHNSQAWRRWFGLVFLALAFGMLVWGQTVFRSRLDGMAYLIYWAICFLLTFLALLTAMLDILLVRRRSREDRKELLRKTVVDLQRMADHEENNEKRNRSA